MTGKVKGWIGKINEVKANFKNSETQQRAMERAEVLLSKESGFLINEAYKALRTNIIFTLSNIKKDCKKIIITSASPGEGKTTTCLNLAIAFAQTGLRVLIIGADLRKPRVYRHLGIERKDGLSDALCGLIDIEKTIKHSDKYGIDCITAGQIPPNPVELLASPKMGEILDTLSEQYDYIFVDTPPVTVVSDATAMSKYVDGVIVVIRQNYTIHETLEKAQSALEFAEAKILGYILNDVNGIGGVGSRYGTYKSLSYSYGNRSLRNMFGNYGNSYGYGYSYGYADYKDMKTDEKSNVVVIRDEEYGVDTRNEEKLVDKLEEIEINEKIEKKHKNKKKKK